MEETGVITEVTEHEDSYSISTSVSIGFGLSKCSLGGN